MALDVYQLAIIGSLSDQPVANVLHFEHVGATGGDPITGAQIMSQAFQNDCETLWLDSLPDTYLLLGYKCIRVNNGGGVTYSRARGGINGQRTGNPSITAAGPCLLFPFAAGGAYHHAKIFVPGVAEADISQNVLINALIAALEAFIGALLAGVVEGADTFHYVAYKRATQVATVPLGGSISGKPGIQNRRLRPTF